MKRFSALLVLAEQSKFAGRLVAGLSAISAVISILALFLSQESAVLPIAALVLVVLAFGYFAWTLAGQLDSDGDVYVLRSSKQTWRLEENGGVFQTLVVGERQALFLQNRVRLVREQFFGDGVREDNPVTCTGGSDASQTWIDNALNTLVVLDNEVHRGTEWSWRIDRVVPEFFLVHEKMDSGVKYEVLRPTEELTIRLEFPASVAPTSIRYEASISQKMQKTLEPKSSASAADVVFELSMSNPVVGDQLRIHWDWSANPLMAALTATP